MPARLTERQRECLILARDRTDKEIARHLGISAHTVSKHISAAIKTLGAATRREAIRTVLAENPPGDSDTIVPTPGLASAPLGEVRTPASDVSITGLDALILKGPRRFKGSVTPMILAFTFVGLVALSAIAGLTLSIANALNPISSAHYAQEQKNDRH